MEQLHGFACCCGHAAEIVSYLFGVDFEHLRMHMCLVIAFLFLVRSRMCEYVLGAHCGAVRDFDSVLLTLS